MPRVDCSGTINRYGYITKKGNKVIRALLGTFQNFRF
ncbi:MAG: hypothetical protein ACTTJ7_01090 [Treponema sp.]